jgi:DNA modification methylase
MKNNSQWVDIDSIKPHPENPKDHEDYQLEEIAHNIKGNGFGKPIELSSDDYILAGHGVYHACMEILTLDDLNMIQGFQHKKKRVKIDYLQPLRKHDEPEAIAYMIADNKLAEKSNWIPSKLEKLTTNLKLRNFDISLTGFDLPELKKIQNENDVNERYKNQEHKLLNEDFIVPPFSVLDTKQGYWQDRKREWLSLGFESNLGRDTNLMKMSNVMIAKGGEKTGTSIFDPVLTEICYKWFCPPAGKILDPFAGGSVRGIVASMLGFEYFGIDLNPAQIEEDIKQSRELNLEPHYYNDNSMNIDKLINEDVDYIFSCPPYHDLEQYTDHPEDISNMDYPEFIENYNIIIKKAVDKLKEDRFGCFVVGDIRDKKGFYRNFVSDTINAFQQQDCILYNEIILLNTLGTAPLRVRKQFVNRKVTKTHQNVLVFYKGNPKNIKANFPEIEIEREEIIKGKAS